MITQHLTIADYYRTFLATCDGDPTSEDLVEWLCQPGGSVLLYGEEWNPGDPTDRATLSEMAESFWESMAGEDRPTVNWPKEGF